MIDSGIRFEPPTVDEAPAGQDALFRRVQLPRGKSLLRMDGTYTLVRTPTHEDVLAAEEAYIGGHIYEITDAVAVALIAAGYLDYLLIPEGYLDLYLDRYYS